MDCQRKTFNLYLIFLQLLFSHLAQAELSGFTAKYEIYSLSITQATVTNTLSLVDNNYNYDSLIVPVGWIAFINDAYRHEYSQGLIKNNQLFPLKYAYQHSERLKDNREIEITFDHTKNKISNFHKHINNKWKMNSVDQVQDRLSSQLALMLALQQSNIPLSYPPQNEIYFNFSIADGGRLKQYSFAIISEEKLPTPLGILNTIKLEHRRSNQDDVMIIWCAEEFAYLPVKILQQQTGLPDYISIIKSYEKAN
ncbi:MAG: DUF3108 domain-containing protein [Pseudomonadota bacterium]